MMNSGLIVSLRLSKKLCLKELPKLNKLLDFFLTLPDHNILYNTGISTYRLRLLLNNSVLLFSHTKEGYARYTWLCLCYDCYCHQAVLIC